MSQKNKENTQNSSSTDAHKAAQLPIFYKNPSYLRLDIHKDYALNPALKYSFAKNIAAVPLNVMELPLALRDYPVVFIGTEQKTLGVIMGLKPDNNVFVNDKGDWEKGRYVPAYVRRYPFILSDGMEENQYALCIDDTKENFITDAKNGLFIDGEASPVIKNAMNFCQSYFEANRQSEEFCRFVTEKDLLSPFSHSLLSQLGLSSVYSFDEQKISKLDDKTYLELREKGYLPFIYAQLFSMNNLQSLYERSLA